MTAQEIAQKIMEIIKQPDVLPEHKLFHLEILAKALGYDGLNEKDNNK